MSAARTIRFPGPYELDGVRRFGRTATDAAFVQHHQHRLRVRASLAPQVRQELFNLVEVEARVLEVLVEHTNVGAIHDGVKRTMLLRPLNEPGNCACQLAHPLRQLQSGGISGMKEGGASEAAPVEVLRPLASARHGSYCACELVALGLCQIDLRVPRMRVPRRRLTHRFQRARERVANAPPKDESKHRLQRFPRRRWQWS
jgi:hypothetical protein